MSRYFLKIKTGGGIELDFDTQDKAVVQSQLDEYFNFMTRGIVSNFQRQEPAQSTASQYGPHCEISQEPQNGNEGRVHSVDDFLNANIESQSQQRKDDIDSEVWEEQQEEVAEKYVERLPDEPPHKGLFHEKEPEVSIEVLSEDLKKKGQNLFASFIVTAYFIKNKLGIKGFNIKFLNSKLYEASGKLIDHDILSEGLDKRLVSIVEEKDEPLRYTLNAKGEEYYSKL